MEEQQELGRRVFAYRKKRKLTQVELAGLIGVDHTYISKVERGNTPHTPSVGTIRRLAAALDADELELLGAANKLPGALRVVGHDAAAREFLRTAAERIPSTGEWRQLTRLLKQSEPRRAKRQPAHALRSGSR